MSENERELIETMINLIKALRRVEKRLAKVEQNKTWSAWARDLIKWLIIIILGLVGFKVATQGIQDTTPIYLVCANILVSQMKALMRFSLDIGCGHSSKFHKRRGDIGLDRVKGKCDICCDAHVLPLRANLFDTVYLMAILEHLKNPRSCLLEVNRVAKKHAVVFIELPQVTNTPKWRLRKFFIEFPFGILTTLRWLLQQRHNIYKHLDHKTIVSLTWLKKYCTIVAMEKKGRHSWFFGKKGRILKRLGLKDRTLRASWKIKAILKN